MSILIFIIVLAILVLVHEFGHFIVAKKSGVRVDEFGIGFPPKLLTLFKWKGTNFTLNLIPFGGFVRIFGENPTDEPTSPEEEKSHFTHKPKKVQALILSAGVLMNLLFAWLLISVGFIYGLPSPQSPDMPDNVTDVHLVVTSVLPDSPAFESGLKIGDTIESVSLGEDLVEEINPDTVSEFISQQDEPISFIVERGEEVLELSINPKEGVVEGKKAIGISMSMIGTLKLPIHMAFWEGTKTTATLLWAIFTGLISLIGQMIVGQADLSQVAGPVGIVGLVGDASQLGFIYLLQFTAFISLNLVVINLIPFPALDGGRLLFLLIEVVKGSEINPKVANTLNAIGFLLLLLFLLLITISDLSKIF